HPVVVRELRSDGQDLAPARRTAVIHHSPRVHEHVTHPRRIRLLVPGHRLPHPTERPPPPRSPPPALVGETHYSYPPPMSCSILASGSPLKSRRALSAEGVRAAEHAAQGHLEESDSQQQRRGGDEEEEQRQHPPVRGPGLGPPSGSGRRRPRSHLVATSLPSRRSNQQLFISSQEMNDWLGQPNGWM
ncbi:hypothetical protein BHM03_00049233, partial [Ensete ventricosum]